MKTLSKWDRILPLLVVPCFLTLSLMVFWMAGVFAQTKPPVLPDPARWKMLATYEHAVNASNQYAAAKVAYDKAVAEWQALAAEEVKENHLAEGTTFQIDVEAKTVTVVPPPAKEKK